MRVRFELNGKEYFVDVECDDLKELVYEVERKILQIASEKGIQPGETRKQYLLSLICEAIYQDIYSEEIDLGELV